MRSRRRGVAYGVFAAICFSFTTPLAKILVGGASPLVLGGLFYFGSGLCTALLAIGIPKTLIPNESSIARMDAPWLLCTAVFGGIVAPVLLLIGLPQIPASNASLLLNFEMVFTILLAWIVFHEKLNRRFGVGAFAVLIGSMFISWNGVQAIKDLSSSLFIVAATFSWGIDNNLVRKISHRNPLQITGLRGLLAGGFNLLLGLWLTSNLSTWVVLGGLLVGAFCFGVTNVFWLLALRHLGSARAGSFASLSPFIGAIISVLLLREAVTLFLLAASLSMAIGVMLLVTERENP